jgi:hypothetical protein
MVYYYPKFFKPLYINKKFNYQDYNDIMLAFINRNIDKFIPFLSLIKFSKDDWIIVKDNYNKYLPIYKSKFPYIMFCTYLYSVFKNINIRNKYSNDYIENYFEGFNYNGFMNKTEAKSIKKNEKMKKSARDIIKKHNLWFGNPKQSDFNKISGIFTDKFLSESFDLYEKNKNKGFNKLVMPDLYQTL